MAYLSNYMLAPMSALANRLLLLLSVLAFGACSLAAILIIFAIDSDAFVFDRTSEIVEG